jgi:hypothetical protein
VASEFKANASSTEGLASVSHSKIDFHPIRTPTMPCFSSHDHKICVDLTKFPIRGLMLKFPSPNNPSSSTDLRPV